MPDLEPITREEMLLDGEDLTPITRKEKFIKRIYDKTQEIPEPVTREEMFLKKAGEGSGGDVTIEQLNVTANGTYSESGKAYSPVVVNVPTPTPPENAYLLEEYEDVPTDIASFTASDAPLKSLTASIVPVQAGSGDPSPTNVRPITGWTEEVISVTGKNLIDVSKLAQQVVTSRGDLRPGVPVKLQAGSYTISAQSGTLPFYITRPSNNYSYITIDTLPLTFSLDNEEEVIVRIAQLDISDWDYVNLQLEKGQTATTYEPFGTTTTIPFTDSQGQSVEVFGGSVDVVNGGEQQRTLAKVDLGDLSWTKRATGVFTLSGNSLLPNSPNNNFGKFCSNYPVNNVFWENLGDFELSTSGGFNVHDITIKDSNYADADATTFKNAMRGVELVFELATPTTFYTQPTSIKSLDGENNVSASTGQIENLEFFTKEA